MFPKDSKFYIVESSSKSHLDGGEFDHLVAYSMACTIENDDEHELKHGVIRFGSLDEVSVGDDLRWLEQGKGKLNEGPKSCLERGTQRGSKLLERGSNTRSQ